MEAAKEAAHEAADAAGEAASAAGTAVVETGKAAAEATGDAVDSAVDATKEAGEAVAEAAVFNRLARYPDDARVELPLPFGIRGLIAIAPSDGQYDPRGLDTRPRGVSYLVVQGSLDGDVQSFVRSPHQRPTGGAFGDPSYASWCPRHHHPRTHLHNRIGAPPPL